MKQLTGNEIKQVELEILLEFDAFCRKNHLTYSLCGGTLLGAIRHHGFIPWDDDIDVCMPRPDYEKLIRSFSPNNNHLEIRSMMMKGFDAPFGKIVNKKYITSQKYSSRAIDAYLWIDIFPVDGLPDDELAQKKIYQVCNFYRKIYLLCEATLGEGKTVFRKAVKYILKPLANIYGKQRCCEKIDFMARKYPYETANYVGAITWGLHGTGEVMNKGEFENIITVDFEGHQFSAFSCWDRYLRGLYDNYMELPPVEKRETHDMEVYLVD